MVLHTDEMQSRHVPVSGIDGYGLQRTYLLHDVTMLIEVNDSVDDLENYTTLEPIIEESKEVKEEKINKQNSNSEIKETKKEENKKVQQPTP